MTIVHGVFLFSAVYYFSDYLNMMPLSCLAAILLVVGYELADSKLFKDIYQQGAGQWIPIAITTVAILFSDLLLGISIGIFVGSAFVIKTNFYSPFTITKKDQSIYIRLNRAISFLNKTSFVTTLEKLDNWSNVIINGSKARFIDYDIDEPLREFEIEAKLKHIEVEYENIASEEFSHKPVEYFQKYRQLVYSHKIEFINCPIY